MISTPRLTLLPLTQEQLNLFVHGVDQLEPTLGLRPSLREETEPLLGVLVYFTMPRLRDPIKYPPLFNTLWIAIDNHRQQIVASAKFKGAPDDTGTIEIGYGTYPVFQRLGYMTEMVRGMLDWAQTQPGVRRVVADTDTENVASQKVLEKCGFRLFDRVEEMLWFEWLPKPSFSFDENGYVSPADCMLIELAVIETHFLFNTHRLALWEQAKALLNALSRQHIDLQTILLDGSFVSNTPYPNDIDLVIFVNARFLTGNRQQLSTLADQFPELHIIWVGYYTTNSPLSEALNQLELFNWQQLFNTDKNDIPKGFFSLIF